MTRPILIPHRLRDIERPFGWIPLRLVRDGHWARLSAEAKILYCLLCIVCDRRGISYYGPARLQQSTGLVPEKLAQARDELLELDLIAFDQASHTAQVLSLPHKLPATINACAPDRWFTPLQGTRRIDASASVSADEQLTAVRRLITRLAQGPSSRPCRGQR